MLRENLDKIGQASLQNNFCLDTYVSHHLQHQVRYSTSAC